MDISYFDYRSEKILKYVLLIGKMESKDLSIAENQVTCACELKIGIVTMKEGVVVKATGSVYTVRTRKRADTMSP